MLCIFYKKTVIKLFLNKARTTTELKNRFKHIVSKNDVFEAINFNILVFEYLADELI